MTIKMKHNIDSEFIKHIREEKLKQQDRRASYVRAKFTFVIGLFGVESILNSQINREDSIPLNLIIYLIPFVTVLFDLYILGGEFAVKRIRGFLSKYDEDGCSEVIWDEYLKQWPKSFMRRNRFWTSNTIFIISILFATLRLSSHAASGLEWVIFSFWILIIFGLVIYLHSIEKMIEKSRVLQQD